MQIQIPIFPENTKLINSSLGFYKKDDFVYYLHNGDPIFCHFHKDNEKYRFIFANLVVTGLCTTSELSRSLGVNSRNINRYVKQFKEKGMSSFFNSEDNRGKCYRMTDDKIQRAQEMLNEGLSNVKIAKELGVEESSIRYHIKQGTLKKKILKKS